MNITSRVLPPPLASLVHFMGQVDWWLIVSATFLVSVGLSTLKWSQQASGFFDKQMAFVWVGILLFLVFSRIPPKFWTMKPVVACVYVINLILLVSVMLKGHSAQGAQRWLAIGPITLQPSEIAKLVVIFTLAAWLGMRPIRSFVDIFLAMLLILPPAFLVFKQPDLGTSLTFGALFLGMTYWAGATICDLLILISPVVSLILNAINQTWWLAFMATLGCWLLIFWRKHDWRFLVRIALILIIVIINYAAGQSRVHVWGLLKEYQQKRLTSFVNPYDDPRGSGYHILQSLIAIGSGGISGTGLGKGNQSQGAFIPERHTDFIFAVVGEELGFRISALIIIAYTIICFRCLATANQCRADPTGSCMAIGLMCLFLFHVFLNIGMTIGIMPVAGVPLPFLSYGGTALLVDLIGIALVQALQFAYPKRPDHKLV